MNHPWMPAILAAVASAMATGAMLLVAFLMRRMLIDNKKNYEHKMDRVWLKINKIEEDYLEKDSHFLICGKQAAVIENMFRACLKQTEDAIFHKLREIEKNINGRK